MYNNVLQSIFFILTGKKLTFKDAEQHCKKHNMILAQEGTDTTAKRQFVKQQHFDFSIKRFNLAKKQ